MITISSFIVLLAVCGRSLASVESQAASTGDLRRAKQPVPRSSLLATSKDDVPSVLNKWLTKMGAFVPCQDFSIQELKSLQRSLLEVRDDSLQQIYASADDNRRLAAFGVTLSAVADIEQHWAEEALSLEQHPELHDVVRDAHCHATTMWWAHHLGEGARLQMSRQRRLPLLPERRRVHSVFSNNTLAASRIAAAYDTDAACLVCHSATDPDPIPGGPHTTWANFNMTAYMVAKTHGGSLSQVQYRYEPQRQALYTTLWAEKAAGSDCSLLFDYDGSVWEWYSGSNECTKLMTGVPVMTPNWATHAGMVVVVSDSINVTNPHTGSMQGCRLYCRDTNPFNTSQSGPCYCETLEDGPIAPARQVILHTHGTHNLSDSRTYYSNYSRSYSSDRLQKPTYCPPQESASVYKGDLTSLEKTCNKCWTTTPVAKDPVCGAGSAAGDVPEIHL